MKILYHHRTQGEGAEGGHIRDVVKALRGLGHEVELLSPPGIDPFRVLHGEANKPKRISLIKRIIYALPQVCFEFLEIFYNLYARRILRKKIQEFKPDFIYERYSFFCVGGVSLAQAFKIPLILEVNEISGIKRQRPQTMVGLCQRFERTIFTEANALIVVSSFLKARLIERGVSANKIFVIPNAVNLEDFNLNVATADLKEKHNLNNKVVLTFVGMFSKWDRLEFLLETFAKVHAKRPDTHLVIVGEGLQRPALTDQARQLGLAQVVTFTGKASRADVPRYIGLADICLLSGSNLFGSPMALFEYMVMAKPVVVPRYGPIEDVMTPHQEGLFFEPDDGSMFAGCLLELIDDKLKRERLGQNGRTKILQNHLWQHNAKKVIEIYKGIK